MSRVLVQFDGSNFYNKVKKLSKNKIHLTNYNYRAFSEYLTGTKKIETIYYVGEIRKYPGNKKSQILYSNQQSLFSNLRKQEIKIKLGYLLMSEGKFHEKGVDVQIAVDIVRGAIKDEYDEFYIISSDTDLLPAIKTAKDEKKKVIYIGFKDYISRALINNCSSHKILSRKDVDWFK